MADEGGPRIRTGEELFKELEEEERKIRELPPSDPEHPRGYARDDEVGGWSLWWGGYDYFIEDGRMQNASDLVDWIEHVGEKTWIGMTPDKLSYFISSVKQHWKESGAGEG